MTTTTMIAQELINPTTGTHIVFAQISVGNLCSFTLSCNGQVIHYNREQFDFRLAQYRKAGWLTADEMKAAEKKAASPKKTKSSSKKTTAKAKTSKKTSTKSSSKASTKKAETPSESPKKFRWDWSEVPGGFVYDKYIEKAREMGAGYLNRRGGVEKFKVYALRRDDVYIAMGAKRVEVR